MAEWIIALILGIIQGLTEFLPVSSSGHLELARFFLGDDFSPEGGLLLTVTLHFATAVATIIVFRKEIVSLIHSFFSKDAKGRKFALYILSSMIPAVLVGLLLEEHIEQLFTRNIFLVGLMLLLTAGLLWGSDQLQKREQGLTVGKSILIGLAQAIAILPGISRSGATITAALFLQIKRTEAARFSFLMVVPLIFGKMILDIKDGQLSSDIVSPVVLFVGFSAALATGIVACNLMIRLVQQAKLTTFALYCAIVGSIAIGIHFFS